MSLHASARVPTAVAGVQSPRRRSATNGTGVEGARSVSGEPHAQIDHRPWGRFDVLTQNDRASVKLLTVVPGGRLSLQRHRCRDEWWQILDDGLVVEVDGIERVVTVGERVWIPRGTVHRICNAGHGPGRFLEIAFGDFDEADIERLSDDYGRSDDDADRSYDIVDDASLDTVTVVVPTFNERDNVAPLVAGLEQALHGVHADVVFVDDSTDGTADVVNGVARTSRIPVTVVHRQEPTGGLSGAVCAGINAATGRFVVVMDGDLQHPPAVVPRLLRTAVAEHADVVVASRYCRQGTASGLASSWRRSVSSVSTRLARWCFPRRVGRLCSDPMTGFFCVRRDAVDTGRLRPRGFKILLEILARHDLRVSEVPFPFGERSAGVSKASWRHGLQFLRQLCALRMGRMARFAAVGAVGTLVNLAIMSALLTWTDLHYLAAAMVATEFAIMHNFLLQERFVFPDMLRGRHGYIARLVRSVGFNNLEALARMPLLVALVSGIGALPLLAQALTLGGAFLARFAWTTRIVYRRGGGDARGQERPPATWGGGSVAA